MTTMSGIIVPQARPADAYKAQIQNETREVWIRAFCASIQSGKTDYQADCTARHAAQEFNRQFNN